MPLKEKQNIIELNTKVYRKGLGLSFSLPFELNLITEKNSLFSFKIKKVHEEFLYILKFTKDGMRDFLSSSEIKVCEDEVLSADELLEIYENEDEEKGKYYEKDGWIGEYS